MPKSLLRTDLSQKGKANKNNHILAFTVLGGQHFTSITLFDIHNHPRRFYYYHPTLKKETLRLGAIKQSQQITQIERGTETLKTGLLDSTPAWIHFFTITSVNQETEGVTPNQPTTSP